MNKTMGSAINAFQELEYLESDGFNTMPQIEWWLKKNEENFKSFSKIFTRVPFLRIGYSGFFQLPVGNPGTDEEKFLALYKELSTLAELHQRETFLEKELEIYRGVKDSREELKSWVGKHEILGTEELSCFKMDYFEDLIKNPNLSFNFYPGVEKFICIERNEFKFTLQFLDVFEDLFWVQEVLPESIERKRIKMEEASNQSKNEELIDFNFDDLSEIDAEAEGEIDDDHDFDVSDDGYLPF